MSAIDALIEIFTWVGLGAAFVFAVVALIAWAADGSWVAARAVVERVDGRVLVRWFADDGGVGEATLGHDEAERVGDQQMTDIFYRRGTRRRVRLTAHSPAVRAFARLAMGLGAFGLTALIVSWVLLFTRG